MQQFLVELDYIKNHFPDFVMLWVPRIIIGIIVLQIILGLIRFYLRHSETGKAEQIKSGSMTVTFILWVAVVILIGVDFYYYYMTYLKE